MCLGTIWMLLWYQNAKSTDKYTLLVFRSCLLTSLQDFCKVVMWGCNDIRFTLHDYIGQMIMIAISIQWKDHKSKLWTFITFLGFFFWQMTEQESQSGNNKQKNWRDNGLLTQWHVYIVTILSHGYSPLLLF